MASVPTDEVDKTQARATFPPTKPSDLCTQCNKTVYPVEKLIIKKKILHRACFRCAYCEKLLDPSNYASADEQVYCKPHYTQLYNINGDYTTGFQKLQELKAKDHRTALSRQPSLMIRNEPLTESPAPSLTSIPPTTSETKIIAEESPLDIPHQRSVKVQIAAFDDRDDQARKESEGRLPDPGKDGPYHHRPSVLSIDSDESVRAARVAGWTNLKQMVEQIETSKRRGVSDTTTTLTRSQSVLKSDPANSGTTLKRSKTIKVYGQKPTDKCALCDRIVYPAEKILVEKKIIHNECLKCIECGRKLNLTNYFSLDGTYYCRAHYQKASSGSRKSFNSGISLKNEQPEQQKNLQVWKESTDDPQPRLTSNDPLLAASPGFQEIAENPDLQYQMMMDTIRPNVEPRTLNDRIIPESDENEKRDDLISTPGLKSVKKSVSFSEIAKPKETEYNSQCSPDGARDAETGPIEKESSETALFPIDMSPNAVAAEKDEKPLVGRQDVPLVQKSVTTSINALSATSETNIYLRQLNHTTSNLYRIVTMSVRRFNQNDWRTDKDVVQRLGFDFVADLRQTTKIGIWVTQVAVTGPASKIDLHASDLILEVNGRKMGAQTKKTTLDVFRDLLKPLPLESFKPGDLGKIDPSVVTLQLTVSSRRDFMSQNYSVSAGRFLYNEVEIVRLDPLALVNRTVSPWQQDSVSSEDYSSSRKEVPEKLEFADKNSPFFTFDLSIREDPTVDTSMKVSKGASNGFVMTVADIRPVPEDIILKLAAAKKETVLTMLPPIFRCNEGELRLHDMICKVDDIVLSPKRTTEVTRNQLQENLKSKPTGKRIVLGLVTRNKMHVDVTTQTSGNQQSCTVC